MKFLKKKISSTIQKLRYSNATERKKLRKLLLKEQYGYCAYSERYIQQTDSVHIEHFYPKAEHPEKIDDYFNLYIVLAWVNEHKPKKIKPFLPILPPNLKEASKLIIYKDGLFQSANESDIKAKNLIKFLGLNKIELFEDRQNHLKRIKALKQLSNSHKEFLELIQIDPMNLSFVTALEHEFQLDLFSIIQQLAEK